MRRSYDTETLEDQIFGSGDREEDGSQPGWEESWETEIEEVELPGDGGPVVMNVTLEDETQTEYVVAGVFLEGEKEYIALETREGDINIMELREGANGGVQLIPIEDKEEQESAIAAFHYYFEQENEDDRDKDREED